MLGDADFEVNISTGFDEALQELQTLDSPGRGTMLG